MRTPPDVSLYHRFENPLFKQVLERLRDQAQTVVLPRTREQREEITAAGGFVVPERAVDAQSLVWHADLVVSAGGTMNREAVALGTPVFTTFEGRLGAVDERLLAEGQAAQARECRRGRGRETRSHGARSRAAGPARPRSAHALRPTLTRRHAQLVSSPR